MMGTLVVKWLNTLLWLCWQRTAFVIMKKLVLLFLSLTLLPQSVLCHFYNLKQLPSSLVI